MQFVFFLQHVSTSLNFRECAASANLTCHLKCISNTTRVILKEVIDQQVATTRQSKDLFVSACVKLGSGGGRLRQSL